MAVYFLFRASFALCFLGVLAVNETAAALRGFNMQTAIFLKSDASFRGESVLLRGKLMSKWSSCGDGKNSDACIVLKKYEDRLSFRYTFDREYGSVYVHREPLIRVVPLNAEVKAASLAKPSVSLFDVGNDGGEFTILFGCAKWRAERTILFELEVSITNELNRVIRFYKTCGAGRNPYIDAVAKIGPSTKPVHRYKAMRVPAIYGVIQVTLTVKAPSLAQGHSEPVLTSSNPEVKALQRGVTNNGTFINGIPSKILITFECVGRGSSIVRLRIPVAPWDDLVLNFKKRCGKSRPKYLQVQTGPERDYVVVHGILMPQYNVHNPVTGELDMRRTPWIPKVDANVSETSFAIQNTGSDPLFIEGITASVINSSVLSASVVSKKFFEYVPFRKVSLSSKKTQEVFVQYTCLQRGRSLIVVTVQTLLYELIEFGYTKYCDGPVRSQLVSTLRKIEWAILAVSSAFVLCLCCVCFRRRLMKRSGKKMKYSEVELK